MNNILSNNVYVAENTASNAVSRFADSLSDYESDPVFRAWYENENNCVGKSAVSSNPTAIQIGQGTNMVNGTFKVLDKVILGVDGFIPTNILPWAATTNDVVEAYNSVVNIFAPKDSPDFTGDISVDSNYELVKFNKTNQRLSFEGSFMCLSGAGGVSQMSGVVIETLGDVQENRYEIHYPVYGFASYNLTNGYYRFNIENQYVGTSFRIDLKYVSTAAKYCVSVTEESDGVVTTCEAYETWSGNAHMDDMARELKIHIETKNPHGITFEDIKEPTRFIDLESPGGNVFRIKVTDTGEITSTRIK